MTQININANKINVTDANYNQGVGISDTIILENFSGSTTGSKIYYFINGLLIDPINWSGSIVIPPVSNNEFIYTYYNQYASIEYITVATGKTVTVDWGDGTIDSITNADTYYPHDYPSDGNYEVVLGPTEDINGINFSYRGTDILVTIDANNQWPINLNQLVAYGSNIIWTINSSNPIPSGLTYLSVGGSSDIIWNVSYFPNFSNITNLYILDSIYFSGVINDLSSSLTTLRIDNCPNLYIEHSQWLNVPHLTYIELYGNSWIQTEVDAILQSWYNNRFIYDGASVELRGNTTPSGIYQFSATPSTGMEYKYALMNPGGGGWNAWSIVTD